MVRNDVPRTRDPGRVIAHRGASQVAPENTLSAFRAAAEQGAGWVEFDVSLLGDGTPVIFHDATLDRCTDATGPLAAIGADDLDRIEAGVLHGEAFAGERIPTLAAALDLIDALGLCANLEMKPHDTPAGNTSETVAGLLAARPWTTERIVTSSFDYDELAAFCSALPNAPIAVLYEEPPRDWRKRLAALGAEAMHIHFTHLRQSLLAEARSFDIPVRVYTINDAPLLAPFREFGLGGVITDHPPLFLDDPDWAAWARD